MKLRDPRIAILVGLASILILWVGVERLIVRSKSSTTGRIERFAINPIVKPEMLPDGDGDNIDGPSLIRVPTWVNDPLGEYYLYFANHRGKYIRLAYADRLEGPWTIYEPGALRIEDTVCDSVQSPQITKHIASPDVLVDEETHLIRMYFHCPAYKSGPTGDTNSYQQVTLVATSHDGINFEAGIEHLGDSYFRVFRYGGYYYSLAMPGVFYRSLDGLHDFIRGPSLFTEDMRHSAVMLQGNTLLIYYSQIGDNPESILRSTIDVSPDWMTWDETDPEVVLVPERDWEGSELPRVPSERGAAPGPVRQLRDPALFVEDGRTYLLYSVAGESGIAIAEVTTP